MKIKLRKLTYDTLPEKLKEIDDHPEYLYIEGTLPDTTKHIYLGVVGPRKYSEYGKMVCEKLIAGLTGHPFVIVSGLALGIDTIAHTTALASGLQTIAVPGSGLSPSVLYPKTNFHLARNIVNAGGCLISEFEPEFKATPWSFPKRNRIVAGLCDAVLVIEASEKSGALITAKFAIQYNRDVLSIPASIYSETSKGSNNLLAKGAYIITSTQDIIQHFNLDKQDKPEQSQLFQSFTEKEIAILRLLIEPKTKSYIYENCGLDIVDCSITISTLELKGIIKEQGGRIYRQ